MVFSCFGSGRQSWQLQASKASFLRAQKATLGTGTGASEGAVARRPGPSLSALLFGCGAGAVLGQTAIVFL